MKCADCGHLKKDHTYIGLFEGKSKDRGCVKCDCDKFRSRLDQILENNRKMRE